MTPEVSDKKVVLYTLGGALLESYCVRFPEEMIHFTEKVRFLWARD
jgi:hypothetical protein